MTSVQQQCYTFCLCVLAKLSMVTRECPVCSIRIVRNDPALATCAVCLRYFHSACLPATAPSQCCTRCTIGTNGSLINYDATTATASCPPATPNAELQQPSSTTTSETKELATPITYQHSSKRRASTPSPSDTPALKAYCPTAATANPPTLLEDTEEMNQGAPTSTTSASFTPLDPDGQIRSALNEAPPYMQHFYVLLKSSHDSNAAALAELKSSHAANATSPAENTRALAENARMLSSLSSRVGKVDQSHRSI